MKTLGKANKTDKAIAGYGLANVNINRLSTRHRMCLITLPMLAGLLLMGGNVRAEYPPSALADNSPLENTGRNVRDSGNATLTPEDQTESPGDLKITTAIRKSVMKHKSLSLDAHNAKIITRGGVVTLRGPVENAAEKAKLQSIAEKTRGVKQVDNQLEPKTP